LLQKLRRSVRSGDIEVLTEPDSRAVNRLLFERFPFCGSWIDWSAVRNHQAHCQPLGSEVEGDFGAFFERCLGDRKGETAYYANDGLAVVLKSDVATFLTHAPAFVDTLHTSYFISADGSWCMTLKMSGEMDFGSAPSP
jgi:hypothetical protein